ncbi:MAG: hypothetical protein HYZ96_02585 [Candidatus Omnitrophica bacterium]|nr:hypothetical protein [Candidatus Omnitrophota bacterium]
MFDRVFSLCVLERLPPRVRQGLLGLRFAYRGKLDRDVIRPSGLRLHGPADWTDAYGPETFLGALFLEKPLGQPVPAVR